MSADRHLEEAVTAFHGALAACDQAIRQIVEARHRMMFLLKASDDRLGRLLAYASIAFGYRPDQIMSRRKYGDIPLARWAIWDALIRDYLIPVVDVGVMFGVGHSTISHGTRALARDLQYDERVRAKVAAFSRLRSSRTVNQSELAPPNHG